MPWAIFFRPSGAAVLAVYAAGFYRRDSLDTEPPAALANLRLAGNNRLLDGIALFSGGAVMRISEMEAHYDQYIALEGRIRAMVENREFPAVFSVCVESFQHIIPAIKYRKKRGIEPETPNLLAFGTICKYAPPLFEHAVLEALAEFVKSERVLARHENDFSQEIEAAMGREEIARIVWNHIERQPAALQKNLREDLGVDQDAAIAIVELWDQLGVIVRAQEERTYRLQFLCLLDAEVEGICLACGVRGRGRKELFFKSTSCTKCGNKGYHHIVYSQFQL
jgi:hypothetical protein